MKYERLTTDNGGFCADCNGIGHCNEDCDKERLYRRLAELEDKIESGKMLEFPCKVGDTVWAIGYSTYGVPSIFSNECTGFYIRDNEVHIKILPLWYGQKVGYVFTDKFQAEARLKELQGE